MEMIAAVEIGIEKKFRPSLYNITVLMAKQKVLINAPASKGDKAECFERIAIMQCQGQ